MRFGGSGSDGPDLYCLCASCLTLAPWRHSTARSMSGTVKNILDGASGGSLHALKGGTDEAVLGGRGLTTPGSPTGAPRLPCGATSRF